MTSVTSLRDHNHRHQSDRDREYGLTEAEALIPTEARPLQPATVSEAQYTYQYDSYGNWTEQTMKYRSSAKDSFTPGVTDRRKLTYSCG